MINNEELGEHNKVIRTEIAPILEQAKLSKVTNDADREEIKGVYESLKLFKVKIEDKFHPKANRERSYRNYQALKQTENAMFG